MSTHSSITDLNDAPGGPVPPLPPRYRFRDLLRGTSTTETSTVDHDR